MQSIKPGRGPSAMNALGGIITIIFGILWTAFAIAITRDAPFPLVGIIFPLAGVLFIIGGIVSVAYNFANATRPNRFSAFDITSGVEEPDPLNARFGRKPPGVTARPPEESPPPIPGVNMPARKHPGPFCPFCGARVDDSFNYCPKCGKDI